MMLKKSLPVVLLLSLLLGACSPADEPTPGQATSAPAQITYPAPGEPVTSPDTDLAGLDPAIYPPPGQPTQFDPLPEDANWVRGEVTLVPGSAQFILNAAPIVFVRFSVEVSDLCQRVRVIVNPPQDGKINLEVYSVADSTIVCAEMINQVVTTITLGTLQPGSYEMLVNGQSAGTFELK